MINKERGNYTPADLLELNKIKKKMKSVCGKFSFLSYTKKTLRTQNSRFIAYGLTFFSWLYIIGKVNLLKK